MNGRYGLAVLFLCLSLCVSAAYGQGVCTMQNLAGTYAFKSIGSSTIAGPGDGFHWKASYAPIAFVGWFTINPDGSGEGSSWGIAGAVNFGLAPFPFYPTFTLNDNCTGTMEYAFGESILKEKFVVLDNGREIRGVVMQTAIATGTWFTTARRITSSCGQNKVHGLYLFECSDLLPLSVVSPPPDNIFAGAFQIQMLISPGGDYSGRMVGKVGPITSDAFPTDPPGLGFPVSGKITVHNDCTAEGTLISPAEPSINMARGVFFDEGRQGYWLPLDNLFPDGTTSPTVYGYCSITLMDR
ncbi:MAG: hypothetical protein ROO76_01910 [Terriglobia bacterium]|jgi:hypothetical protein|nr:hypothetical protein [Terriglobia bacterium]